MSEAAGGSHPHVTSEQMHRDYIVRFEELKQRGIPLMFIDSILPGHQRMNYAVVGDTASENPEFAPAITVPHKFQIGMGFAAPGNGPALHTHDYVEMFLILKGKWRFYWGNTPDTIDGEVILRKWDMITLPPGLYRGFEVAGKKVGWFFAVLDPHPVFRSKDPIWAPQVERLAAEHGFRSDENGKMVPPEEYAELREKLRRQLEALEPDLFGGPRKNRAPS
jgi:mannose-6-phosphate isomerase-like protein (cupin superfamily)